MASTKAVTLTMLVAVALPLTSTLLSEANVPDDSFRSSRDIFDFGLKLQRAIQSRQAGKNVVVSPTGVVGVLALILLGSVGKTYDELVQSLGFASDVTLNQNHHRLFGEQLQKLNSANVSSKTLYANAVFVDADAHLRHVYKEYLDHVYKSSVFNVDFQDSTRALKLINEWVSEHTNKKIQEMLKEPLPMDTKVVLASALHFSGQWLSPFLPQYTQKLPFSPDSHDTTKDVIVDSMLNIGKYRFARSFQYGCELVAIPYNDSATTFYALKPIDPKNKTLENLLEELDAEKIESLIDDAEFTTVIIRIPKMNVSSRSELKESLETLGIRALFSPNEANFALMVDGYKKNAALEEELTLKIREDEIASDQLREKLAALPNPGLFVDSLLHDVAVSIDEYGTEAVAATVGLVSRSASTFRASTPFYFFIRDERSKLVTFSAAIYDPTK